MYSHPALQHPQATNMVPGVIVEHKDLPAVSLVIVSGPERGLTGEIYKVRKPDGRVVPVLRKNLKK